MKTKTQFTNRILSLVLSIMMVVSMLPAFSLKAEAATANDKVLITNGTFIYLKGNAATIEAGTKSGYTKLKIGSEYVDFSQYKSSSSGDPFYTLGDSNYEADLSNTAIYGGQSASMNGNVNITMTGGVVECIWGSCGGLGSVLTGNVNITLNGGRVTEIYGAYYSVDGNINITVTGGTVSAAIGFIYKEDSTVSGDCRLTVTGGSIGSVYITHGYGSKVNGKRNVYSTVAPSSRQGIFDNYIYFDGGKWEFGGNTATALNGNTLTIESNQTATVDSGKTLSGTIVNNGTISVKNGGTLSGTVANNGTIWCYGNISGVANSNSGKIIKKVTASGTNITIDDSEWQNNNTNYDDDYKATLKAASYNVLPKSVMVTVGDTTLAENSYTYNSNTGELIIPTEIITADTTVSATVLLDLSSPALTVETEYTAYTYTGSEITPAITVNGEKLGENDYTAVYTNNIDCGTASVTITGKGNFEGTTTKTFEIKEANISDATVTLNPTSGSYNGIKQEPTVSVTLDGFGTLVEGTDYTLSWNKSDFTNADSYTVTVTGKGNFEGTVTKTFNIAPKEIRISWGATGYMPYTGQLILPKVSAIGVADGDTCEVLVSVVETVDGAGIDPGKWTARIVGLSNGNYKLPENSSVPFEAEYTIYATQPAPNVFGVPETTEGKNDGYISGLTTEMEYAIWPTTLNGAYTKVIDPKMIFAPGTYYVRYAAKEYHYSSPYTVVTVAQGKKLTVTLPSADEQIGYTIQADKTDLLYGDFIRIAINPEDGYSRTEKFAIYHNGVDVTDKFSFELNVLTLQYVTEDVKITIAKGSFADTTDPVAEIALNNNKWTSFRNGLPFGLFFKETQDVTITATDVGSGVKTVQYYLSDRELERDEAETVTNWVDYTGTFKIDPDNKYVIYAKITDNDGNVTYVNSEGIVLDATAPVFYGIEDGGVYHGDKVFKVLDDHLAAIKCDGVDVTEQLNGDNEYKIIADNNEHTVTATDKAGNVTEYTITVYKKYMVTYTDGDGGSYEKNFNYGEVITIPTNEIFTDTFRKTGHTVKEWQGYTEGMTMPLENLTFTAVYAPLEYTVTYMADGESVSAETVEHGKDATLPVVPAKNGYVGKWDSDGKNIIGDTTITAVYTALPTVKPDAVKPEDKTDLEDTKAMLEEELKDDTYTEDEKKDIQDAIDAIDAALEVIDNVETVKELIENLPETVTKANEAAVNAADDAYTALSDYERTLVGENAKKALDEAKAALAELNKPIDTPATGNNGNMFLWIALLFISGGTVITLTVVDRKRRIVSKR